MKQDELTVYALIAFVALLLGYGASVYYHPQISPAANSTNATVDMVKINKLKTAFEGYIQLQTGSAMALTYSGVNDSGQYVQVTFTDTTGKAYPLVVSRDYQYLYGSATKIDDFYTQVQQYLAQSANQTQQPSQLVKSDHPNVELFVMSYCPYGTQTEKALLPVQALLSSKANISIKFVSYTMHGGKEVQENTRQYCMMQSAPDKYWSYLGCFLEDGNASRCISNLTINETAINTCINQTYSTTGISESGSAYPIYAAENTQYGVQGSPTLVINGVTANVARSPEAIKEAICSAFNTPPSECNTNLSTTQESPGFGNSGGSGSSNTCGA